MIFLAVKRIAAALLMGALVSGSAVFLFAARATLSGKGGAVNGQEAPKTIITGTQMNLLNKGEAVEFVGGVKVTRGNDFMSADKLLSEEKKNYMRAWGHVYLRRDMPVENVRWEAWSQEGAYFTDTSTGTLWNKTSRARMRRSILSETGPAESRSSLLEIKAHRITFFQSTNPVATPEMVYPLVSTVPVVVTTQTFGAMEAEGDVYVFSQEISTSAPARKTEIWSSEAFVDGRTGRAVFWNKAGKNGPPALPHARQEEGESVRKLRGETLVYYMNDRRLVVQGRVKAEMWGPQNSTGAIKSSTETIKNPTDTFKSTDAIMNSTNTINRSTDTFTNSTSTIKQEGR